MTQKHCLLHSVQCWAQLKCYCRKLLHLCFCFHLSIYLWVESAFRGDPVTPVVSCMFFIIIQADLLGFNICGSLYQAPGNKLTERSTSLHTEMMSLTFSVRKKRIVSEKKYVKPQKGLQNI